MNYSQGILKKDTSKRSFNNKKISFGLEKIKEFSQNESLESSSKVNFKNIEKDNYLVNNFYNRIKNSLDNKENLNSLNKNYSVKYENLNISGSKHINKEESSNDDNYLKFSFNKNRHDYQDERKFDKADKIESNIPNINSVANINTSYLESDTKVKNMFPKISVFGRIKKNNINQYKRSSLVDMFNTFENKIGIESNEIEDKFCIENFNKNYQDIKISEEPNSREILENSIDNKIFEEELKEIQLNQNEVHLVNHSTEVENTQQKQSINDFGNDQKLKLLFDKDLLSKDILQYTLTKINNINESNTLEEELNKKKKSTIEMLEKNIVELLKNITILTNDLINKSNTENQQKIMKDLEFFSNNFLNLKIEIQGKYLKFYLQNLINITFGLEKQNSKETICISEINYLILFFSEEKYLYENDDDIQNNNISETMERGIEKIIQNLFQISFSNIIQKHVDYIVFYEQNFNFFYKNLLNIVFFYQIVFNSIKQYCNLVNISREEIDINSIKCQIINVKYYVTTASWLKIYFNLKYLLPFSDKNLKEIEFSYLYTERIIFEKEVKDNILKRISFSNSKSKYLENNNSSKIIQNKIEKSFLKLNSELKKFLENGLNVGFLFKTFFEVLQKLEDK